MPAGFEAFGNNSIHTRLFGFHRKAGRTDHMHHCHSPLFQPSRPFGRASGGSENYIDSFLYHYLHDFFNLRIH
jgi:hypothetical protein